MNIEDISDDDQIVILCAAWDDVACRMPGSIRANCSTCNAEISLSIQGQDLRHKYSGTHTIKLVCVACLKEKSKEDPSIRMAEMPGTVEAIKKEYGVDLSRLVKELSQMPLAEIDLDRFKHPY
jgi:hypothetical protein